MKNTTKVLMLFLILTGCATPYQRVGLSGGYSDTRLQENVFTVSFRGNGYTSVERSSDFALLRCAELTIENGFKFFAIADSSQDQKTILYNTGGFTNTYGMTNIYGNTAFSNFHTYHSGSATIPIIKPRSSYTIYCFAEKPEKNIMVFDAYYLYQSIRRKYNLKVESNIAAKTMAVSREENNSNQKAHLKSFLFLYCQAYQSKDLNKFATFFTSDATENNRPFKELLPTYHRNMAMIESFNYQIDLISYSIDTNTGNLLVKGKYFTRFLYNGKLKENSDNISMEIIKNGDSFLIKRLNYNSHSGKNNQPQWGPWIKVEGKE